MKRIGFSDVRLVFWTAVVARTVPTHAFREIQKLTGRQKQSVWICVDWCQEKRRTKSDYGVRKIKQSPEGEEGVRRERAHPVGQRAHVPLGAGAEPAPARAVPRGGAEAQATPADPEEPGLRRQLPRQEGLPARGPGAAEEGAPARGGAAGGGERRHEEGAGGARGPTGRPAAVRQGPGVRRGQPPGHGATPQHRLRHHHRQDAATASDTARAGRVLGPARWSRTGEGHTSAMQMHARTHTDIYTVVFFTHTHTCMQTHTA